MYTLWLCQVIENGITMIGRIGIYNDDSSLLYTLWLCQVIAIEHGHRNSEFSQLQNGGSFHSFL